MARLIDLPTELVNDIAYYLVVHHLQSFALSCKAIYTKCKDVIEKDKRYRAKYRRWSNRGPRLDDVFYFLYEIAKDPIIAEYVESLSLWDRRSPSQIEDAARELGPEWRIWEHEDKLAAVEELIQDEVAVFLLETGGIDPVEWWHLVKDEIAYFNAQPIPHDNLLQIPNSFCLFSALTLLTLLPNLRELGLHPCWPGSRLGVEERICSRMYSASQPLLSEEHIREMAAQIWEKSINLLRNLVRKASSPANASMSSALNGAAIRFRPLARLETLLPYIEQDTYKSGAIADLGIFLALPNMQNLYTVSGICDFFLRRNTFTWDELSLAHKNGTISLPLRRLEMVFGSINPGDMRDLLRCCHCLEVVKLVHETKHYLWNDFDVGAFVQLLADYSGATLKELALRLLMGREFEVQPVTGLQGLAVLEKLEIDVGAFSDCHQNHDDVKPLATMLPPSIRTVYLNLESRPVLLPMVTRLVDGLAQAQREKLTSLEKVVVQAQAIVPEGYRRGVQGSREIRREAPEALEETLVVPGVVVVRERRATIDGHPNETQRVQAQAMKNEIMEDGYAEVSKLCEERRKVQEYVEAQGIEWVVPSLDPHEWYWFGWVGEFCTRFGVV